MARRIYTGTDTALMAKDYDAQADQAYYRARKNAQTAHDFYRHAASQAEMARWLTRRIARGADMGELPTPAEAEESARTWVQLADSFLESSFRDTERARSYAAAARRYRRMAAEQAARIAS
jgi:hypothetical protein